MDEITKQKIANALRGRKRSATTIKRISQSLKGRKLSIRHKQHIKEAMRRRKLKKVQCKPTNKQPHNAPLLLFNPLR